MPGGRPLVRRAGGCPRPAPMNRIGSGFIHVGIRHPDNPRKTGAARFIPTCGALFHRTRFRIPEQQLFRVQPEFHAPRPARGDRPETFGFGVGHVRGVGRPRLRFGTAVGHPAAVVPDRPIGRLPIDLVESAYTRTQILDQRTAERLAVHLDLAQRESPLRSVRSPLPATPPSRSRGKLSPTTATCGPVGMLRPLSSTCSPTADAHHVIRRLTAPAKGNLHRRMKPHAHGHRLRTAVGEHHLLLQPFGRKAVK